MFLLRLSKYFEIVVFSDDDSMYAQQISLNIDPKRHIIFMVFGNECARRDQTTNIIKDLSYLNRDLSRVLIIDKNVDAFKLQPDNGIILPEFKGDSNDK